ncbi:MAG: hypothetical protein LBM70_02445, partial [Victivallales bacterium]|nr:hypothetical protein [Victivallales bacterium]
MKGTFVVLAKFSCKSKIALCVLIFGAVGLCCYLYCFFCPGDYIEPGALWRLVAVAFLYACALSTTLLLKRRLSRIIYFAFPLVLAIEEALNFAPPDRYYAVQQLIFGLQLTVSFWCADL